MTSIYEMITDAQDDSMNVYNLISKFKPLLKKYANFLKYEDAYNDLQLKFIEFLLKLDLTIFGNHEDYILLAYIEKTIYNNYKYLLKRNLEYKKYHQFFGEMSENEMNSFEISAAVYDHYNDFDAGILRDLTILEFEIIFLYFYKGYTITKISENKKVSRQAVNQSKTRALSKLRKHYL